MSYYVEESHIKENERKVRVDYYVVLKVSATDLASVFDEADFYATEHLGGHIVRRKYKEGLDSRTLCLSALREFFCLVWDIAQASLGDICCFRKSSSTK